MYEFLDLLQRLPRPLKYLGAIFILIPMVYVISRWLGVERYWWVFVLGLLVIVLVLGLFNMALRAREKRQANAFEGELRRDSQKAGASKEEVRQALGDLTAKWSESVNQLKQAGLSVYSLPWYLLIGEPQSGKSTTLKNSGLEFPVGTEGLSGAGGTRNCDWWFANEAVILDTAGRFTFQEEAAPDQQEWGSFLKLLRRYRKYCPINGVLVVIPCTSLLEDAPEERERKAANIRAKLLHVQRVLQIRFPVFIMVTKADRILGFSEFFSKLDPVDQQQLFGWSSPEGPGKAWDPESFDGTYDAITERLYKLRLRLLADEENPAQADKLYVFPEEFRALQAPLKGYLKTIFQQTRFDEPFAFRGFYISSGVQQGRPIAQATRDLLEAPGGASEGVIESLESIFKKSRAFFIRHFYEKKVFPEQGLITRTAAAEAQQRRTLWLVRGLGVLVLLLFLAGMIPAYRSLQGVLNPIRKDVKAAQECVGKPCPVARAWDIALRLQNDRDQVVKRRWMFTLFLRGTRSNELTNTLARIQEKVYVGGVVAPLLAEVQGRMAALDWESFSEYRSFRDALGVGLDWLAFKKAPEGLHVAPQELRVQPLVEFARRTKGAKATDRGAEIDEWVPRVAAGDADRVLEGARVTNESLGIAVPDPAPGLSKYEEYWTVGNLARWDKKLQDGLNAYMLLYGQMASAGKTAYPDYLVPVAAAGKKFKDNYDGLTRHMATPRPGSKGAFPGAEPSAWKQNLDADYGGLLRWAPVAANLISETRRDTLKRQLDGDWQQLQKDREGFKYLLETDPAGKVKWSKPAESLAGVLNGLAAFSDPAAYRESEDGKLVEALSAMPNWDEKKKKIDEWRGRQDSTGRGLLGKSADFSASNPDPAFQWTDRRPRVDEAVELGLLARTVPPAQQFFGDSLGPQCPPASCYTPVFAKAMMSAASGVVFTAAGQRLVSGWEGVAPAIRRLSETESAYLRRYIDQMAGHAGSGGGFFFPSAAAEAGTWPAFRRAVSSWQPSGGGGGAAAPDLAAQLSYADMQTFVQENANLGDALDYYKNRIERPRAAAAGERTAPELLAAAEGFRGVVQGLADGPLEAWKQLAGSDAASLKQYKVFSENPRLRGDATAQRMKHGVEDHGAHLLRDEIRPRFEARGKGVSEHLNACCLGKFPFINDLVLQSDRPQLASGQAYSRGGPAGAIRYTLDIPTISPEDVNGPLAELGALASEFGLDPILRGEAREFDFVGDPRPIFAVARDWQLFLFGANAQPGATAKQHNIEVRLVERTPSAGTLFLGDRVGQVTVFDHATVLRPSTDVKTGRTPPPFVWRLAAAASALEIIGRNEDVKGGWTGSLVITGGPLRLFAYILRASEDRRPGADPRVWDIRVEIPDAERAGGRLQGVFELKFDDPLPGVIHH
jgi:hypothetical protein